MLTITTQMPMKEKKATIGAMAMAEEEEKEKGVTITMTTRVRVRVGKVLTRRKKALRVGCQRVRMAVLTGQPLKERWLSRTTPSTRHTSRCSKWVCPRLS